MALKPGLRRLAQVGTLDQTPFRRLGQAQDGFVDLVAQRAALVKARDDGDLDDEVLRAVLDGLDVEEAAAEARLERWRQ